MGAWQFAWRVVRPESGAVGESVLVCQRSRGDAAKSPCRSATGQPSARTTLIGSCRSIARMTLANDSGGPIFEGQAGHLLEVLPVASHQSGSVVQSDGGDREVQFAEMGMLLLQVQVQRYGFAGERQDADESGGLSNFMQASVCASQLFSVASFSNAGVPAGDLFLESDHGCRQFVAWDEDCTRHDFGLCLTQQSQVVGVEDEEAQSRFGSALTCRRYSRKFSKTSSISGWSFQVPTRVVQGCSAGVPTSNSRTSTCLSLASSCSFKAVRVASRVSASAERSNG